MDGKQKITDKVLSLLEFLESKCNDYDSIFLMDRGQLRSFDCKLKEYLHEISLEAFAEINKEDEDINP